MSAQKIYFPGLNGLRMISALAVVISHTTLSLKYFGLNPHVFGTFDNGEARGLALAGYGVSIFFVISGFLITYLLMEEKKSQEINIRKFYLRRILRIWPLYYLYLAVALICIFIFSLPFNSSSLLLYVFFAANVPFILMKTLPLLGHYWSLGVEEQFYLFWPFVVKKSRNLFAILAVCIAVIILLKMLLHFTHTLPVLEDTIHVTAFHRMMIGAIGAILYRQRLPLFLKICDNKITQLLCWIIILLTALNSFHVASVIDNEIISVVALLLIIGQIQTQNRIVNLENKLFDFLGKISYGIYVIHPLVIFLFAKIPFPEQFPPLLKYLYVYFSIAGLTLLFSGLSYHFFESYFLKLKKKFEVVKSASSRQEAV